MGELLGSPVRRALGHRRAVLEGTGLLSVAFSFAFDVLISTESLQPPPSPQLRNKD